MPKIIIITLIVASTIFSNCNTTQQASVESTTLAKSESVAPAKGCKVTVLFNGLMVFRKEKDSPRTYEVGVLETPPPHRFEVIAGASEIVDRPTGHWRLEITNWRSTKKNPWEKIPNKPRRPDHKLGQSDFSWIIDLESREFHDGELKLKTGMLKPIIHLPNGELYTKYKSGDLKRWQRGQPAKTDFGFVPEAIALPLELNKDQMLVLRDDVPGGKVVELVKYNENSPEKCSASEVHITNRRHPMSKVSDFGRYYDLIEGYREPSRPFDHSLHYDFEPNRATNRPHPYNPYPGYELKTCCMMACTVVLLGKQTIPLQ
jgi:hypothetical protein